MIEHRKIISLQQQIEKCQQEMQLNGIPLNGPFITDGEVHRFSMDHKHHQKDEWYIAHQGVSHRGNPYLITTYGSWSTGEKYEYRSWQEGDGWLPGEDELQKIKKEVQFLREKAREEQITARQQAAEEAQNIWNESSEFPECEDNNTYFEKKQIPPLGEVHYGNYFGNPCVILPLGDTDYKLKSLQFIWVDQEGKTQKRFLSGGEKLGHFTPLKPLDEGDDIYICEGYATGVSIQRVTERPVVIAFDSGNLKAVTEILIKNYPYKRITIAADNDHQKQVNTGLKVAKEIQEKYGCPYTFPEAIEGVSDFNDLQLSKGSCEVKRQLEDNEVAGKEKEYNEVDPDDVFEWEEERIDPFPIEVFPENNKNYINELKRKIQVSTELVVNWLLPTMSTVTQHLGDIDLGTHTSPLSLFTLGIADSGERKTAVLKQVLKSLKKMEMESNKEYEKEIRTYQARHEAWKNKGKKKDEIDLISHYQDEPKEPISPKLFIKNPTIEGIAKQFTKGHPSLGLFNDESGQIFGGFSMGKDRNLHGITSFSCLWDGEPIERTKAGEFEATSLYNKRLSAGLAVQPRIFFEYIWSNKMMIEQGFLPRFLVCRCPEMAGSRVIKDREEPINEFIEKPFIDGLELGIKLMREDFKLEIIHLSEDARKLKTEFERELEKNLALGGEYYTIKPFACKIVEQAIRIAAVISLFDNIKHIERERPLQWTVSAEYFKAGKEIASWYLRQIIKLFDDEIDEEVDHREKKIISLIEALQKENPEGATVREICQKSPRSIGRKKSEIEPILEKLNQQGRISRNIKNKVEKWTISA